MMSQSREFAAPSNAKPSGLFWFPLYVLLAALAADASAQEDVNVTIETYFSPYRNGLRPIQDAWVREVGNATSSIRVAMYSFTLQAFKNALIEAEGRGVDVRVVADAIALFNGAAPSCLAVDLYNAGIPIKLYMPSDPRDIVHNKYMLIDEAVLVTGSANFTTSAVQFNHENSIIIKKSEGTPRFITSYRNHFEAMWEDKFTDFNGSFVDWVPQGSCR